MRRLTVVAIALGLVFAAAAAPGCGSSSSGAHGAPDASTDGGASDAPDSGPVEGGEAGEAGPDCGAMPPTGTQVVASTHPLVVFTLTQDGHAVYEDLSTQELYAVATAGGTPSDIGKMTSQGRTVYTHGAVVLYLPSAADPSTSIAPLSVWTPSGGTTVISTSAVGVDSYYYTYDASEDGKYVAYFATSDDRTATLTVSTIDGKTQMPLASNIDMTNENCFPPLLEFAGNTLIAQYCPALEDASAETTTIAAFTDPEFTAVTFGTTFQPPAGPVAVDPTGKLALLLDPSGTGLSLYPLAGGNPVTVDPTGTDAIFTPTGDILYTTNNTALMRYSAKTSMATTLVASGLNFPTVLSPDGNWLQAAANENATTGLLDLYLVSATTPGPAVPVVTTPTTSPLGFTADSKYSLFGTNFPMDFGAVAFTLEDTKATGGTPTKVLSVAAAPFATAGSKVITNTNQSKSTGAADIVELDLSTTSGPTTLVTQADPNLFYVTTSEVVYSWYCDENAMAGIWTLTPP